MNARPKHEPVACCLHRTPFINVKSFVIRDERLAIARVVLDYGRLKKEFELECLLPLREENVCVEFDTLVETKTASGATLTLPIEARHCSYRQTEIIEDALTEHYSDLIYRSHRRFFNYDPATEPHQPTLFEIGYLE